MATEYTNAQIDRNKLEQLCRLLLIELGENPERPGLIDTPRRWANWWNEFINFEPGKMDVCFESVATDQMVVVSGIRVWSLCEHHLLPFWCDISIGYIARDKVLGLSKFARIAHKYAHGLQIQERLVHQIADEIQSATDSPDVAVIGSGVHLCMVMRGVKTPATMKTSVMRGVFLENTDARREFLQLVNIPQNFG